MAQLTGDMVKACWDKNKNNADYKAIGELEKTAKPEHLEKIKADSFDIDAVKAKMRAEDSSLSDTDATLLANDQVEELLTATLGNINFGQLKSLYKRGQNPELVSKLITEMDDRLKNYNRTPALYRTPEQNKEAANIDKMLNGSGGPGGAKGVRTDNELSSFLP